MIVETSELIYYDEMKAMVDYYVQSLNYRGEALIPISTLKSGEVRAKLPVILGRNGHYHHYDLEHLQILRRTGVIPAADDTTLALYDWHEDLDHDPAGTELGNGTWAYLGLVDGLYHDLYILGTNPRGYNELNVEVWGEATHRTTEETMKILDRVYLYPLVPTHYCLKLFEECVSFLDSNPSVERYYIVREGGFAVVKFRGVTEASYMRHQKGMVVSIDLDVLRRSHVMAQCPQGAMSVDELLAELTRLRMATRIDAILLCGLTEVPEHLTESSLLSMSRILSYCSTMML